MDFNMPHIVIFEMNDLLQKARMFLGDRWVEVGDFEVTFSKEGCTVIVPDVESFLASREHLDDGTFDWATWGPRMN